MAKRFGTLGRAVAVAIGVAIAFGLAGCGNQQHSAQEHANMDLAGKESDSDAPLGRDEIISVIYEAAMEVGSMHLAMTMEGGASTSSEGDVSYDGGNQTMQATVSVPMLGPGKIQMRYVDKVIYMQIPGMTPPGKFVVVDPSDESSPLGKSLAGLGHQLDPLASMKALESAVTSAKRVGEEDLGGTSVDHYRLAVDTQELMKELEQPKVADLPTTYDVWLDGDNLIRKMSFGVAGSSVEMLLSKWGEPVNVERPAAADIVKLPGE